jgi:hypothetical protein
VFFQLSVEEPNLSIVVSILVSVAVAALVGVLASILIHPHVCSLMQGDWFSEPDHDPSH